MQSGWLVQASTRSQPVPAEAEVAFVPSRLAVEEGAKAPLDHPAAKAEEPNKGDAEAQQAGPGDFLPDQLF